MIAFVFYQQFESSNNFLTRDLNFRSDPPRHMPEAGVNFKRHCPHRGGSETDQFA
jgi:hypothetical protein